MYTLFITMGAALSYINNIASSMFKEILYILLNAECPYILDEFVV